MPFQYNYHAPLVWTALHLSSSVVPAVFSRPTFWLFFLMHICVYVAYGQGYLADAGQEGSPLSLNWRAVQVITSMTTFFEVFYTNHVYARYERLFFLSRSILGQLNNFVFDLRVFAHGQQDLVRLATRYFASGVFLFFAEVGQEAVSDEAVANLIRTGLMTEEELLELNSTFTARERSVVVMHWSGRVLREALLCAKAPNNVLKAAIDRLIQTRDQQQQIRDTLKFPIPFPYFHLLNAMVVVNLLLWAYGMGLTRSYFAPLGFFFAELIFCGMVELAGQLSDPFGNDAVDFPLTSWLATSFEDTRVLLEYKFTLGRDGWAEVAAKGSPLRAFSWVDSKAVRWSAIVGEEQGPSRSRGLRRQEDSGFSPSRELRWSAPMEDNKYQALALAEEGPHRVS